MPETRPDPASVSQARAAGGAGGVERRRTPREPHLTAATLQPATGDASVEHQVLVFNLSLGGVGFRSHERFCVGETYRITVGAGPLFLNARIRIVNLRPRNDGTLDVGAEFY